MGIANLLDERTVLVNVHAASKKQVLALLAEHASAITGLPDRAIFDVLLERERLGSTGVGRGVAIPHGRPQGLPAMFAMLAKLDQPIAFEAVDDEPVDIVFLLLAPECAGAEHLKCLARASRLLRDRGFCERLRAAETVDGVLALLGQAATSNAA